MKKNRYEAQALAIAMVILVVSSILGMSIYSRVSTDKSLAIKEQASAEALEVADLLLDYIVQVPIADVISNVSAVELAGEGTSLKESDSEITNFFELIGVEGFNSSNLGFCSIDTGTGNEYTLTVKEADEDSFFEIRPGNVRSFLLTDLSVAADCTAGLTFDTRGETQAGFSIAKIYKSAGGDIKEYEIEDVESYCFSENGIECNSPNFGGDGWNLYTGDSAISQPLADSSHAGYVLDEVRLKAIGGTVGMAYSLSASCPSEGLRLVSIQAEATCNGVYRAKELLVPENQWSLPIFDYVIFNGEGAI